MVSFSSAVAPARGTYDSEQRYVAVTEGDTITYIAVESNPGEVTVTAADKILPWL